MFKKLSISSITGIGFGLILLVMATEITLAMQGLNKSSRSFAQYRRLARSSILSGRVQANMLMASRGARDFVQTGDESHLEVYRARYKSSLALAMKQLETLQDPQRRDLSRLLVEQLRKYDVAILRLFELVQQRNQIVQKGLLHESANIQENLRQIIETARRAGNHEKAASCLDFLESMLLGQLDLLRYLEENSVDELLQVRTRMSRIRNFEGLATGLDAKQRRLINEVSSSLDRWVAGVEDLVSVGQQRDALLVQDVRPLDESITRLSEEIKLSLKFDQDALGPKVQAANSATARTVFSGSLLGFSLAFLIALLFIRAITRSVSALRLSQAETKRLSRDVSTRKQSQLRLANALQEVERVNFHSDIAMELTVCGYWHVDSRDPEYYYLSRSASRILGEPWNKDGRFSLRDEWLKRIEAANPESAHYVSIRLSEFINKGSDTFDIEYPYQRPADKKKIWIHAVGKAVYDEEGKVRHVYGAYQDITQRVEAESSLQRAKESAEKQAVEMQRSLNAAAKVQQSMLPTSSLQTELVEFAWRYQPCEELAGDFLNFFRLGEQHVAVYMIDVSGHGVASSLLSVTVGHLMTPQVSSTSLLAQRIENETRITRPSEVANQLNQRFSMEKQNGLFFTMLYGVLNLTTRKFQYVSAGQLPLILIPRVGAPRLVESCGPAIGWFNDAEFNDFEITLEPGDRLYIYSDGVSEATNREKQTFSSERLKSVIADGRSQSLDLSLSTILESVLEWCGETGPKDDISLVGLQMSSS